MINLFSTIGLLATGGGLGVELINQHTNKELVCYINELSEENTMKLLDAINNGELAEEILAKYGLTNIENVIDKTYIKECYKDEYDWSVPVNYDDYSLNYKN